VFGVVIGSHTFLCILLANDINVGDGIVEDIVFEVIFLHSVVVSKIEVISKQEVSFDAGFYPSISCSVRECIPRICCAVDSGDVPL